MWSRCTSRTYFCYYLHYEHDEHDDDGEDDDDDDDDDYDDDCGAGEEDDNNCRLLHRKCNFDAHRGPRRGRTFAIFSRMTTIIATITNAI